MDNSISSFNDEIKSGKRFQFGKNWRHFSKHLDPDKIGEAEKSLISFLGEIKGKKFIDVGSGSGLFSLAAMNLGANVFSFDYDPSSVFCADQLKQQYFPSDTHWTIEQGSILDDAYLKKLGQFDIVYSWGVLHHTGRMWDALSNAAELAKKDGLIFISIYNTQPFFSRYWTRVKRLYNSNFLGKFVVCLVHIPYFFIRTLLVGIVKFKNILGVFSNYKKQRGMSVWYDWIDWLGGYPFETATPEQIVDFFMAKGFHLTKVRTTNQLGCNQFVFRKGTT